MAGWFHVYREIVDSDLWLAEPFTRGQALVDLYGLARHAAGHVRLKGVRIELLRGQLAWSEQTLAKRWRWSRGKVRRFLAELTSERLIVQQTSNVTSVITMLKYDQQPTNDTASSTANRTAASTANGTRKNNETMKQSPPPTPSSNPEAVSGIGERWGEVGKELRERGVSCEADAVATADTRGLTPNDVMALIEEWDRNAGAYGPGALFQRITGQLRSWPPAAPEFERARAREGTFKSHEANVAKRAAGRQSRDDDTQLLADLDAKHGATIAAMTSDEVVAALGSSHLADIYRSRGVSGLVRDRLYDVLENAAGATTGAIA